MTFIELTLFMLSDMNTQFLLEWIDLNKYLNEYVTLDDVTSTLSQINLNSND